MICAFPELAKGTRCVKCGYALKRDYEAMPFRGCGNHSPAPCQFRGVQVGETRLSCPNKDELVPLYQCAHPAHQHTSRNGVAFADKCTEPVSRDYPLTLSCHNCGQYVATAPLPPT